MHFVIIRIVRFIDALVYTRWILNDAKYFFSRQNIVKSHVTFKCKGWFTLGPTKAEPSQAEREKVFTLAIMFTLGCVRCHASEVRRGARVYPGCLVGINKLVSVTVARCNKKKQLLLLLLWYWRLKSVHKLKGEGSLQYWTALIKSSATLPLNGILSKVNLI